MKKALGKKRWGKIEDYSFEMGVIDIAFKYPWIHEGYCNTIWVCMPFDHDMSKSDTVSELKDFIDEMSFNPKAWQASQGGTP